VLVLVLDAGAELSAGFVAGAVVSSAGLLQAVINPATAAISNNFFMVFFFPCI
jgi:hypothetical protein